MASSADVLNAILKRSSANLEKFKYTPTAPKQPKLSKEKKLRKKKEKKSAKIVREMDDEEVVVIPPSVNTTPVPNSEEDIVAKAIENMLNGIQTTPKQSVPPPVSTPVKPKRVRNLPIRKSIWEVMIREIDREIEAKAKKLKS